MIAPGARVGDFELLARLGRGGQGEVFLARPWVAGDRLRHLVRLWLRVRLAAGALGPAAALRWGLAAIKIAHSNAADSLHDEHGHLVAPGAAHRHLAQLYSRRYQAGARDFGYLLPADAESFADCTGTVSTLAASRRAYLALAYVPGRPLAELIGCGTHLPPAWSVSVAMQIADALAHLHRRGIVHHDLRPANVLISTGPGKAPHSTLIDLGAAETPSAPRRRAIYGTVSHLPPERTHPNPASPTPLVDLYGLGVMLRELTARVSVSPPLAALIADATAADPALRRAAVPHIDAMIERLAHLPEAR